MALRSKTQRSLPHLLILSERPEIDLQRCTPGGPFAVERASTAEELVELIEERPVEAVLFDLVHGEKSCRTVWAKLAETAPEAPLLLIHDRSTEALARRLVRRGAHGSFGLDQGRAESLQAWLEASLLRRGLQRQSAVLEKRSAQMRRQKQEFVALVTHELRNPLSGIVGYAHLLSRTDLNPLQKEYVETLLSSARGLSSLLDHLLELSSSNSGTVAVERAPLNLREALEQVMTFIIPQARQRGLEVVANLDATLPKLVAGDSVKLRQVVLNLLLNSVKFTDSGYLGLSARVKDLFQNRAVVRFVVEDSGRGIPEDKQKTIFLPFNQAEAEDRQRGAGLGLAICLRTVEALGGVMGVESRVGRGTAFWFDLPFEVLESSAPPPKLRAGRLLLIEPQRETAQAISLLLEQLDIEHLQVDDLEQAKCALEKQSFRTVLAPESIDTLELPVALRLLTSFDRRGKGLHGELYLARPLRQSDLVAALTRPVESHPDPAQRGRSALVLEDDLVCSGLLENFLTQLGYRVTSCGRTEQALQLLQQDSYQLLIADLHLPDGTSRELLETVHSRGLLDLESRIVVLTGSSAPDLLAEGLIDTLLRKPLEFEDLELALQGDLYPIVDHQVVQRLKEYERRTGGNFVQELVSTYKRTALERVDELERAFQAEDATALTRAAHGLKGAAGTVGAALLHRYLERLEGCTDPLRAFWLVHRVRRATEGSVDHLDRAQESA